MIFIFGLVVGVLGMLWVVRYFSVVRFIIIVDMISGLVVFIFNSILEIELSRIVRKVFIFIRVLLDISFRDGKCCGMIEYLMGLKKVDCRFM